MLERRGFDKIIGQDIAGNVLMKAVRGNCPSHAYLFLGLEGTGKTTTALEFAKALNCENQQDGNACGECAVCNAIEHGNFPDIRVWSPDGQNTSIKLMREMRDLANFRPVRGKWKINVVEQADTLNEESANCILKLLEEPPDYLINILVYKNAASVMPTIKSRCQLIRFTQANTSELVERLVGEFSAGSEEAAFLAAYSQGCPGKAIRLIGKEDFYRRRSEVIEAVSLIVLGNKWSALKLAGVLRTSEVKGLDSADDEEDAALPAADKAEKKSKRDLVIESLDMLMIWYRDLLAAKLQGIDATFVNVDKRDDIIRQAGRYPHAGPIYSAVEAILHAKRAVMGNANAQIVTEALVTRLMAN